MKHKLIVMMAPSGVGKTYLANYIKDSHEDVVIVSRDKIRAAVLGGEEWSEDLEVKVKQNYFEAITKMLKTHSTVIADATHLTLNSRQELFEGISIPGNTEIVGVWIESSVSTAIKQNAARPKNLQVPEETIEDMFRYAVSPREWEPFDNMVYLMRETNIGIHGRQLDIKNVFEVLDDI